MKIIKISGKSFKLIPQTHGCMNCYFNDTDGPDPNHCTVDLTYIDTQFCCGHDNIIYERISVKEILTDL